MKIQGINFRGFRPIIKVSKHGNNGNSEVEGVEVTYRKSNYLYDESHNIIYSQPVFEEFRIPKVAVMDILDNYQISKETRQVLEKYSQSDSQDDIVLQVKKGTSRIWKIHLSILDTGKFVIVTGLLVAILVLILLL